MSEEEELSGETLSDISFARRQRELRSIYRDFRKVLSKYEVVPPSLQTETEFDQGNDSQDEFAGNSKLRLSYEVRGIIRELQSMREETLELKTMVARVKTKRKSEIEGIVGKFDAVLHVLSHQIERAQSLLEP
jgi:hypothetical protein